MAFGNVGSTKYIPISLAALLFFIYPPVVATLNHAIAKKWPSLIKTISITVAFLGLAVMLGVDLNNLDLRGVVIGITAGIACAVNIIWVARKVPPRASVCNSVLSICYSLSNNWCFGLVS